MTLRAKQQGAALAGPSRRTKQANLAAAISILCFVSVSAPFAQTMYKSVTPDGKIVYSDKPPTEGRVEKTMKFENLPSSTLPASAASYTEQLRRWRASWPTPAPSSGTVLFTASWCGYCKQAKAHLGSKGVSYQEIDIDTSDGIHAFAQAGGGRGVPLLLTGGHRVQGYSASAYEALFAKAK